MNKSIIVAFVALIVLIGAVGSLYAMGYFNTQPQQQTTIRVGYLQGDLHQLSFQVALSEGYFNQSGITVVKIQYPSGPAMMQALVSGDLDFGYVGVVPAMQAYATASTSSNATNAPIVIGSANQEGSAIVVNPNQITSISQLNGTTIGTPGVGTIQDLLLTLFAQQHNLTITKYPSVNAHLVEQFETNVFNGYIAWEPTPSQGVIQANGSVLATSHDILPNHQCCVLVVTSKYQIGRAHV
jgi:NitT/TauT family transport system substrate-binding protein